MLPKKNPTADRWPNLSEADLTGADLTDTTVTATDLRGTKLDGVVGANFTGAILE